MKKEKKKKGKKGRTHWMELFVRPHAQHTHPLARAGTGHGFVSFPFLSLFFCSLLASYIQKL